MHCHDIQNILGLFSIFICKREKKKSVKPCLSTGANKVPFSRGTAEVGFGRMETARYFLGGVGFCSTLILKSWKVSNKLFPEAQEIVAFFKIYILF